MLYTGVASAGIVRVPDDAPTIQAGLDAAAEGDTVLVAPGTYTGDGNHTLDFSASTDPAPKNVVLSGVGGAEATIIDVDGSPTSRRRAFEFSSGESSAAVVEGFTIRNGYMSDPVAGFPRHELSGGGIVVRNSGTSPTIRDCVIESCTSFYSGGGIEAELFASPTFERCVIRGNVSEDRGGGISVERFATATLIDCVITGNRAAVSGGGLEIEVDTVVIGCTIAGNAAGRGGGIDVKFPAAATLTNSIVVRNVATGLGDDIYVGNDSSIDAACAIVDTSRVDVDGTWAAIDVRSVDPLFCAPVSAGEAPTIAGTYSVDTASPALDETCAPRVGALSGDCTGVVPVVRSSWRALKRRF